MAVCMTNIGDCLRTGGGKLLHSFATLAIVFIILMFYNHTILSFAFLHGFSNDTSILGLQREFETELLPRELFFRINYPELKILQVTWIVFDSLASGLAILLCFDLCIGQPSCGERVVGSRAYKGLTLVVLTLFMITTILVYAYTFHYITTQGVDIFSHPFNHYTLVVFVLSWCFISQLLLNVLVEIAVLLKLCRISGYERLLDAEEEVLSHQTSPVDRMARETTPPPGKETDKRTQPSATEIQDVLVVGSKVAWTSGWPTFTAAPPQQTDPTDRSASRSSKRQAPDGSGRDGFDCRPQLEYGVNQTMIHSSDSTVCEQKPMEQKPCGKMTPSFPVTVRLVVEKQRKGKGKGRFCPKLVQPVLPACSDELATNAQYRCRSGTGELVTEPLDRVQHETTVSESRRETSLPFESSDSLEPGSENSNVPSQPYFHIATPFLESETNHFTLPFAFGSDKESSNREAFHARGELNKPSLNDESSRNMTFLPPRPRRNKLPIRAATRAVIPNPYSKLGSVSSSYPPQMLYSKQKIPLEPNRFPVSFHSELETKVTAPSTDGSLKPPIPEELGSHGPMLSAQLLQASTQIKSMRRVWSVSKPTFPPIPETSDHTTSLDPERVLAPKLWSEISDLTPFPGKETHDPTRPPGKETVASTKPPGQATSDPTPPPSPETHDPISPLGSGFHHTIPPPGPERHDQTPPVGIVARDKTPPPGKETGKRTRPSGTEIQDSTPSPGQDNFDRTSPPDQATRYPTPPEGQYTSDSTPPPSQETRFSTLLAGQDTLGLASPPGPEVERPISSSGHVTGYWTPPEGQDTRDPTLPEDQDIRDQTPYPGQETCTLTPPPGQETRYPTPPEDQDTRDQTPYLNQKTSDHTQPPHQEVCDWTHLRDSGIRDSTVPPCVETGKPTTPESLEGEVYTGLSGDKPKPVFEESSSLDISTAPGDVSTEKRS